MSGLSLRPKLLGLWWVTLPFLCGFGPPRLVDDSNEPNYRISTTQLQQWASVQQLQEISADALLVYDLDSDRLLFARNGDSPLPPASLTKLMTALLVLEAGDLQAPVTVFGGDLIGNSNMGLQAGEVLSVEQLLDGLLINSANDAAMALARHESGSTADFVTRMNQRATELNLRASNFRNPHGLDEEGHLSSAHDLLMLTQKLWHYPLFREIVAIEQTTVAGHALLNTNEFLGKEQNINGVKTGTTDFAGECLITGELSNGHQRFIIVLGSDDRYADTRKLIALADKYYPWLRPDPWQLSLLNRTLVNGKFHYYRPDSEVSAILLDPFNQNSVIGQRNLISPTAQATATGEIIWKVSGKGVASQLMYSFLR